MTVSLWRIAAETKSYKASDISGGGAAKSPGRWNDEGEYVVYAAPTIALAVLETAAHVQITGLPLNRYLVRIDVPNDLWDARIETLHANLDAAWTAIPHGLASISHGSAWYQGQTSLLLTVPSVIVPEEHAVLINAKHPDAKKLSAKTIRKFEYDLIFR